MNRRCVRCDTRLSSEDDTFSHRGLDMCCECMSALCSWYLDGGPTDDAELWPVLQFIARPEAVEVTV